MRANPKATSGTIAEHLIVIDLLARGYEVTLPAVDNGADCHARIGGVWYSVQVKRAYKSWSNYGGGGKGGRVIDADLLALVLGTRIKYKAGLSPVPAPLVTP